MTPEARLAALEGRWSVRRAIRHADGARARFRGVAEWAPAGAGLRCEERGRLEQGGAAFEAARVTLWAVEAGRLTIRLADGRPFCAVTEGWARHDCAPDVYLMRHGFACWPCWTLRWRVTGPRKDWRALSVYAPAAKRPGAGAR
jgi:hypothetical protein